MKSPKPATDNRFKNLCGIVTAILKMATGRNFSMSGIISEFVQYCDGHFENGDW